ncbi:MAG: acyl-CoA thioesterase II [Bacteroidota bacterium]
MKSIAELIDLLKLERIEENIYRGQNYQAPWGSVFGGQVMAQAVHAARRTVPEDRLLHSLHGYFILRGDISIPIVFQVDRIRDGRSFTTRRVVAIQKGKAIFNLSASFHVAESGFEHQMEMPKVPQPDDLISDQEWAKPFATSHPGLYKWMTLRRPVEFRPVERFDPVDKKNEQAFRHIWLKAKEVIPDNVALHREILAYASDYNLMGTSLQPHRANFERKNMQVASLDHAMWFHHDVDLNDWILYALDSPSASGSRGFSRGNFFNQNGKLVASVVQEGLIRDRTPG